MATSFGGRAAGEIIRGDDRSYDFDMILMLMESWLNMFSWTTWQLIPRPWWSVWRSKCSWTILSVMFNHILKNELPFLFWSDENCCSWLIACIEGQTIQNYDILQRHYSSVLLIISAQLETAFWNTIFLTKQQKRNIFLYWCTLRYSQCSLKHNGRIASSNQIDSNCHNMYYGLK